MQCPLCGATIEEPAAACPSCGADLTSIAPGAVVAGRYQIRSLLGRGGMGSVYRAFDPVLDEEVALKIQRAEASRGAEAERRLRTEVKLARQVSHPNVCRLHDGGQEGGRRWISMELVDGVTVAARLRDGTLEAEAAWAMAQQAADGLAAVHRAGVVHRDLKTLNLMVDRSGRLRLMDFGIAKPAAGGETGAGGYALGSPEYMSPEQARGRPADVRSDVYSLGVVLFELFTGRVPFRAETPVATLLEHLEKPPPLDQVPAPLRPVLACALAKDPRERFQDGDAMAEALRAAREGHPLPAPRRPAGRRVAVLAAFATLAVAIVAVVSRDVRAPLPSSAPAAPPTAPGQPSPAEPRPRASAEEPTLPLVVGPQASATPRRSSSAPLDSPAVPASSATTEPGPVLPTPAAALPTPAPPEPTPATAPVADGALLVVVRPWADVSVDGIPRGQTPLGRIVLAPGPHQVLLTHPDYQPYPRRVTVRPGETLRLEVDLRTDGVRRHP